MATLVDTPSSRPAARRSRRRKRDAQRAGDEDRLLAAAVAQPAEQRNGDHAAAAPQITPFRDGLARKRPHRSARRSRWCRTRSSPRWATSAASTGACDRAARRMAAPRAWASAAWNRAIRRPGADVPAHQQQEHAGQERQAPAPAEHVRLGQPGHRAHRQRRQDQAGRDADRQAAEQPLLAFRRVLHRHQHRPPHSPPTARPCSDRPGHRAPVADGL